MNENQSIVAALIAYYASRNRELDDFSKKGFMKRIEGMNVNVVLKAIEEARFSSDFPDVTQVLIRLNTTETVKNELKAREQWQEFKNAVHFSSNPKFDDPVTAYIAQNVVNIWDMKQDTNNGMSYAEKRFVDAYQECSKLEMKQNIALKAPEMRMLKPHKREEIRLYLEAKT